MNGKQLIFLCLIPLLLNGCCNDPPQVPDGCRLRDIVSDLYPGGNVLIGATPTTATAHVPTDKMYLVLNREFSYITPSNDFKQAVIHPDPDTWDWSYADTWEGHIAENDQVLRMHGPISPQCSRWAKGDDRTALELETNMEEFFASLCQRYNGVDGFKYLDVVNETVVNGAWHENKAGDTLWECPWFKIGQDNDTHQTPLYIIRAFEIAKEYAPDLKLIYNHNESPEETDSWSLIKETVLNLRARGLRVDAIGWQAHVNAGDDTPEGLAAFQRLIDWAQENDLEFHITEASVWLKQGYFNPDYMQQAATYAGILEALLEKRDGGVVGWNTWHIADDAYTWHSEWLPALFDACYRPKPAYYAIQRVLEDPL